MPGTRVTFYYSIGNAGFSETFGNASSIGAFPSTVIPTYIAARLAASCPEVVLLATRISSSFTPRFVKVQDYSSSGSIGTFTGPSAPADDCISYKLGGSLGGVVKGFFHGMPGRFIQGNVYVPSGGWINKFTAYLNQFLIGAGQSWQIRPTVAHTLADRHYASAATPNPGRGYRIFTTFAGSLPKGSLLSVGGQGVTGTGYNGRKIVIFQDPGNTFVDVGGAIPLGTVAANTLYFYLDVVAEQPITSAVAFKLTDRDVGRPFGSPVGRRKNTLALRR